MSQPHTQTNHLPEGRKERSKARVWLLASLIMTLLAIVAWVFSASASAIEADNEEKVEKQTIENDDGSLLNEVSLTRHISELEELQTSVKPISFDAIIMDRRSYPDEFKDKKFLIQRQGKWTIQVMNVNDHEIINDYLDTREDRSDFAYFRYIDDFDNVRYLLVYGVMGTEEKINNLLTKVDFGLPDSVKVQPVKFNDYVNKVDNYELGESIVPIGGTVPREIKLSPTRRQVPVRSATPKPATNSSSATTPSTNKVQSSKPTESQKTEQVNKPQNANTKSGAVNSIKNSQNKQDTVSIEETQQPKQFQPEQNAPTAKEATKPQQAEANSEQAAEPKQAQTKRAQSEPKQATPKAEPKQTEPKKETAPAKQEPKAKAFNPDEAPT